MNKYSLARAVYRRVDQWLLRRLPATVGERIYRYMFPLARRLFPVKVKARSASEFVMSVRARKSVATGLPAWAASEVARLVKLEPLLASLVGEDAQVESYAIPWDMNYVGRRYADARHQLNGPFATIVLVGATADVEKYDLSSLPKPMAIIDVDNDDLWATLARTVGADYVPLPAEYLNANDQCAVMARLVLQVAPDEMRYLSHPVIDRCLHRHGLAMASITRLAPLFGDEKFGSDRGMGQTSGDPEVCVQDVTKGSAHDFGLSAGNQEK